jgi:RNA polymerase sigma-70 factor (ECF subfamily)
MSGGSGTDAGGADSPEQTAQEAQLARRAAEGDGAAFATLYDRYEQRIFTFCQRLTGSADDAADATQEAFVSMLERLPNLTDRDLNFGAYLFTTARHSAYRVMEKRHKAEPTDVLPERGASGGGFGAGMDPDQGDPEEDPERKALVEGQQEQVRAAHARLPERQREVLVLRELEEMSYDEIAAIMEMNRNSVAQLISRARIKLRDELRGEALASIATSSPECEKGAAAHRHARRRPALRPARARVARPPPGRLRHLPRLGRGDARGGRLLPLDGADRRVRVAAPGVDRQGGRAHGLRLERRAAAIERVGWLG